MSCPCGVAKCRFCRPASRAGSVRCIFFEVAAACAAYVFLVMSFFDGSTSSKKKDVNLGGRSLKKSGAVVETKEQLAERNAKARVQREHVRAENSASLCISLSWRVRRARFAAISRIDEVVKFALNDSLHSASVLSPNHLGPPSQSIIDQSIRALCCCFNVFMFLRKSANHKLRSACTAQCDPPLYTSTDISKLKPPSRI